jgi:hypothetical protein
MPEQQQAEPQTMPAPQSYNSAGGKLKPVKKPAVVL